tara:strand:+ start:10315 stop:11133 length:819 start_codon:yes stop_codon:yes gene_type:complete
MKKPSDEIVFKAFVTNFSDDYVSNWTKDSVYGRMDPLAVFQNTTREVSLSFDIPAAEGGEALENLQKVERLIQGLYPLYQDYNSVPVISAAPLWKIKMANFLSDSGNASDTAKSGGLLCSLAGFSFEPDLDQGYFVLKDGQSFPKNIKASLQATIFHNHTVGFDASSRGFISNMAGFPYGVPAGMADKKADMQKSDDAEVKKFLNDNRQTYQSLGMTDEQASDEARRQAQGGTLDDYASQLKRIKAEREKKSKKVADKLKQQKVKNALQKKT